MGNGAGKYNMKRLPVGIQTFRTLRENDCVYADKTQFVYELIEEGNYFFLSRPRRFGKSLLLDTIAEVFLGNRSLFHDLWIDSSDYAWERHPVIRLDMTQMSVISASDLNTSLMTYMRDIAGRESLSLSGQSAPVFFSQLIVALHEKYGRKVVVLVDEYDKPIVEYLNEPKKAERMRKALSNFYGILERPNGNTYVIEFKYVPDESEVDAAIEAALSQIASKRYAEIYRGLNRTVFRVAIAVSGRGTVRVRYQYD